MRWPSVVWRPSAAPARTPTRITSRASRAHVLGLSSATPYRLAVRGAAHLTFTDATLYLPPLRSLVGSLDRTPGPRITAAASLAFLDSTLRDDQRDDDRQDNERATGPDVQPPPRRRWRRRP